MGALMRLLLLALGGLQAGATLTQRAGSNCATISKRRQW
jgi:hypothetical protein